MLLIHAMFVGLTWQMQVCGQWLLTMPYITTITVHIQPQTCWPPLTWFSKPPCPILTFVTCMCGGCLDTYWSPLSRMGKRAPQMEALFMPCHLSWFLSPSFLLSSLGAEHLHWENSSPFHIIFDASLTSVHSFGADSAFNPQKGLTYSNPHGITLNLMTAILLPLMMDVCLVSLIPMPINNGINDSEPLVLFLRG